jgi:hypothetical protein
LTFIVTRQHWSLKRIGYIHDLQQEEDARREKVLIELGLRIVRFRNDEVVENLSAVVGNVWSRAWADWGPCNLPLNLSKTLTVIRKGTPLRFWVFADLRNSNKKLLLENIF